MMLYLLRLAMFSVADLGGRRPAPLLLLKLVEKTDGRRVGPPVSRVTGHPPPGKIPGSATVSTERSHRWLFSHQCNKQKHFLCSKLNQPPLSLDRSRRSVYFSQGDPFNVNPKDAIINGTEYKGNVSAGSEDLYQFSYTEMHNKVRLDLSMRNKKALRLVSRTS